MDTAVDVLLTIYRDTGRTIWHRPTDPPGPRTACGFPFTVSDTATTDAAHVPPRVVCRRCWPTGELS